MTGRTANEAVRAYSAAIAGAVAAFAIHQHLVHLPPSREIGGHGLTVAGGGVVPLRDASARVCVALAFSLRYRISIREERLRGRGVAVETVAYTYGLEQPGDPPIALLRYDWHPYIQGTPRPHVHVGEGIGESRVIISERTHVPTGGFITLRDVIEHAMMDFGVVPLRRDWQKRLLNVQEVLLKSLAWADPRG